MKKSVAFLLSILVISCFASIVKLARASATIYIRADGSIDPPTAPISTVDNVTYTLTGNVTSDANGIVVERTNITVDGNGYTLLGTGNGTGLSCSFVNSVTIKNTNIENFATGLKLESSSNSTITANDVTSSEIGINVLDCSNIGVVGNSVRAIGGEGIYLELTVNTRIRGNRVEACNWTGIYLYKSDYNNFSENSIANNLVTGIHLDGKSNYNIISGNNITNNIIGIDVSGISAYNSFYLNDIRANTDSGIYVRESSSNRFYHNKIIDNRVQVAIGLHCENNTWDDGYPSGGNYWSNYAGVDVKSGPNQDQPGSDEIGDAPYPIDANNTDHYPLMTQPIIPEFPAFLILPLFMILSLVSLVLTKNKRARIPDRSL